MPQKRNPERSEHLVTLARVVRAAAGPALEGLVAEHERDGAAWKAEWAFLPQACGAAAAALSLAVELVGGLRVDAERMRANLDAQRGYVLAEAVMLGLAERVGQGPRARARPPRPTRPGGAGRAPARRPTSPIRSRRAASPSRAAAAGQRSAERALGAIVDALGDGASGEPPEGYLGAEARIRRGPAPELVEAGYKLELADAPLLWRGLGLADLAHTLVLRAIPPATGARCCAALLELLDRAQSRRRPALRRPREPARAACSRSGSATRRAG